MHLRDTFILHIDSYYNLEMILINFQTHKLYNYRHVTWHSITSFIDNVIQIYVGKKENVNQ